MKYYTAVNMTEIPRYATKWLNLTDVMLSERSRAQKDAHYRFSF